MDEVHLVVAECGTVRESISSLEVTSLEEVEMTGVLICARSTDRLSWNLIFFRVMPPFPSVVHR